MENSTTQNGNSNIAVFFHTLAFIIIIAVLLGRNVLPEIPFRTSYQLPESLTSQSSQVEDFGPDRVEFAGVLYGCGILLAGLLWASGCAAGRNFKVRASWMVGLIAFFAVWSFLGVIWASDKRAAVNFAFMQSTIMFGGWLVLQLCAADRRRICILFAVLGAFGVMLACKGLWQEYFETPQRIEHFRMYRSEILQARGIAPDSPSSVAYESRLAGQAPIGYIAMANPFGSMLLLLGSILLGVGIDRFKHARADARETASKRKKGDLHAPTFAAVLCLASAVLILFVTVLTRSRGAIGSLVLMGIVCGIVLKFREQIARNWKKCLSATVVLVAVCAAGVIGWGLRHDSLPTKTMTFRWYYWTGAAEVIKGHPLFGSGGGNFGTAYLQHRRPAAEEASKTPHNFIMHSLSQYGLPGGLAYLCVLGGLIVMVCRPAGKDENCCENTDSGWQVKPLMAVGGIVLAVFGSFAVFTNARDDSRLLTLEFIDNGIVLVAAGVLMFWAGGGLSLFSARVDRFTRVIAACGLVGFVLHNVVTFSLWMGGAAMLFWVAGGAVAGMVGAGRCRDAGKLRWAAVAILGGLCVWAFAGIYKPVAARQGALENLYYGARVKDASMMLSAVREAVQADPLDGYSASLAARVVSAFSRPYSSEQLGFAQTAISRDKMNASHYKLAADILWGADDSKPLSKNRGAESLRFFKRAVELDSQDMRMRVKFAKRLIAVGGDENKALAEVQLREAMEINDALFADSIYKLSADELKEIRDLQAAK